MHMRVDECLIECHTERAEIIFEHISARLLKGVNVGNTVVAWIL